VQQQKQPAAANTSCAPSGSTVSLVIEQISWDKGCIAAKAGQPIQVTIDNRDKGIAHNFAVYTSSDLKNRLFLSPDDSGPATTTFTVPALPAGTYYFQCDIHGPAMAGTLVVG
jgi:plastocyanin